MSVMQTKSDTMVDDVLAALRGHPVATEAVERVKAARQAERLRQVAAIEDLRRECVVRRTESEQRIHAADAAVAAAEKALAAAKRHRSELSLADQSSGLGAAHQIGKHEAALIANAEPEIDAFIEEMRALFEHDRFNLRPYENVRRGTLNIATMRRKKIVTSNGESINERIAGIRQAIQAAEELKLDPDQSDVVQRLEALRASIPKVEDRTWTMEPLFAERR